MSLSIHEHMFRDQVTERILNAIDKLSINPRPAGCVKLVVKDGYRIRIGKYRILYDIDDQNNVVVIQKILFRKDAY